MKNPAAVATLTVFIIAAGPVMTAHAEDTQPATPVVLTVQEPGKATSQKPFPLTVTGTPESPLTPGEPLIAEWTTPGSKKPSKAVVFVTPEGTATFTIGLWKTADITVTRTDGTSPTVATITVKPQKREITAPEGAPKQNREYRTNTDPAAIGHTANPEITHISKQQKHDMTGLSWHPGCVPISNLREIHVNYWGLDGYRHRGTLIANKDVAEDTAALFTDLYNHGYRIHSMHPVDVYGKNPRGPGADDYKSMAAGNTSMFNCRYVVGKESSHAISPHASGRVLDINPWENPYLARGGIYPNRWWFHRGTGPLSFLGNPETVHLFSKHGFRWGAHYSDYHHFDK